MCLTMPERGCRWPLSAPSYTELTISRWNSNGTSGGCTSVSHHRTATATGRAYYRTWYPWDHIGHWPGGGTILPISDHQDTWAILYSKHVWDDHQRCPLQSDLDGHWWQQPNRWIRHSRCSAKLIGSLPQWQLISFGVLSDRYTFQACGKIAVSIAFPLAPPF